MILESLTRLDASHREALAHAEREYDRARQRIEGHYQAEKALIEEGTRKEEQTRLYDQTQAKEERAQWALTQVPAPSDRGLKGFFARLWGGM